MDTYLVTTNLNADGAIIPAGTVVRQDRFAAERLALLLSLGLLTQVLPEAAEAPTVAAPTRARKSPETAKE